MFATPANAISSTTTARSRGDPPAPPTDSGQPHRVKPASQSALNSQRVCSRSDATVHSARRFSRISGAASASQACTSERNWPIDGVVIMLVGRARSRGLLGFKVGAVSVGIELTEPATQVVELALLRKYEQGFVDVGLVFPDEEVTTHLAHLFGHHHSGGDLRGIWLIRIASGGNGAPAEGTDQIDRCHRDALRDLKIADIESGDADTQAPLLSFDRAPGLSFGGQPCRSLATAEVDPEHRPKVRTVGFEDVHLRRAI